MKFLKFYHKFAHGHGQPEIIYVPDYWFNNDGTLNEEFLDQIISEYNYSDRYRGIDWEILDEPPNEWIEKRIEEIQNSIKSNQEYLQRLKELLNGPD